MFGAIMFVSKQLLEFLPNVHLLAMFTVMLTVVYRAKALVPIYIFVVMEGVYAGFNIWWYPYLYLWLVLWGAAMLLPKNMKPAIAAFVYPVLCALHGLLYGTLYAPYQALVFGLDFKGMIAWIAAGLPWDLVHCAGNFAAGFLVLPLSLLVKKLENRYNAKIGG